jgi:hypothetical protein
MNFAAPASRSGIGAIDHAIPNTPTTNNRTGNPPAAVLISCRRAAPSNVGMSAISQSPINIDVADVDHGRLKATPMTNQSAQFDRRWVFSMPKVRGVIINECFVGSHAPWNGAKISILPKISILQGTITRLFHKRRLIGRKIRITGPAGQSPCRQNPVPRRGVRCRSPIGPRP